MHTATEYESAIARYYDAYFTGIPGDVAFYVEEARRAAGAVLELGCGSGRTLIPTAQAGVPITGLDAAPEMLALARARAGALDAETQKRIKLVDGDMRDFAFRRRFKLITLPYRAFQHLLTPADQVQALLCIRQNLARGGRLVFNILDPSADLMRSGAWLDGRAPACDAVFADPATGHRVCVWCTRRYDPVSQIMDQVFIFEELDAAGAVLSRIHRPLTLRCVFRAEMQYLLELCGYTIEALYGGFDRSPYDGGEQIWCCQATSGERMSGSDAAPSAGARSPSSEV